MRRPPTLFVALVLAACASAASAPRSGPAPRARRLVVVGINDTHGALLPVAAPRALAAETEDEIGGAQWMGGWLAAIRASERERGGEVIVLDGGDAFQGTLISNQFRGRSVVDVYNALGIAAAAIGNHEFDFGIPVLEERIAQARFPFLAANVFRKGTRERPPWAKPSALLEIGGVRVGIVGLATAETPTTTNPALVAGLEFARAGPIAAAEADALRSRGATVVLLVAHAGPLPPANEIQSVAEACRGKVDAIVSGHHHVAIQPPLVVAGIPIVQSGAKLQNFSTIELTLDAGGRANNFAVNEGNYPKPGAPQPVFHTYRGQKAAFRGHAVEPDDRVGALLRDYDDQVRKLRETRIGATTVDLRKGGPDDLLGNLTTDALRSGAGGGIEARYALQNSGGLRVTEIPAGPITFGQIFDLYPFDNEQVVVSLSAEQLRTALETVLKGGKGPLRVSGLRYAIDWDSSRRKELRNAPAGAIVTKLIDDATGRVLCETTSCTSTACESTCVPGTSTVSVTDFLANGGDGLRVLEGVPRQGSGTLARDVIVEWIKQHDPLTPRILHAPSAGGQPRIVQQGPARAGQIGSE